MTEFAHKDSIIKIISAFYPDAKIYLFGSYARGTNRQGSDIDIAIDVGKRLNLHERQFLWNLLEALPMAQTIDLVDMNAIPDEMRQIILEHKTVPILKIKYNNFTKAATALKRAITTREKFKQITDDSYDALFSAGVIKHFEFTYNTALKFLQQYLLDIHTIEIAPSKLVFIECYKLGLFPEKLFNELNQLADARNNIKHTYDQILAKKVTCDILKHHLALEKILELVQIPNR